VVGVGFGNYKLGANPTRR